MKRPEAQTPGSNGSSCEGPDLQRLAGKTVLFLHHGAGASGADVSLSGLIRGLAGFGIRCTVACTYARKSAPDFFRAQGIHATHCRTRIFRHTSGGWDPLLTPRGIANTIGWTIQYRNACRRLSELIKQVRPDIVHLNSATLVPYLPVCSRLGIPSVLHVREHVHSGMFGIRKSRLEKIALKHASALVFICEANRRRMIGNRTAGSVVYNPVDFKKFDRNIDSENVRQEIGIGPNEPVILFLGGSGLEIKGIMPFLESLRILKQKLPGFKCVMLGTSFPTDTRLIRSVLRRCANAMGIWSFGQTIWRRIAKFGLRENVLSLPFQPRPEPYYAMCRTVAVPFVRPHFARQIIEAGAMAKPVAASDIDGIKEIVVNGKTGILCAPGNSAELADALFRLLSDPGKADKMGETAYDIAKRRYTLDISAGKIARIYGKLIHERVARL